MSYPIVLEIVSSTYTSWYNYIYGNDDDEECLSCGAGEASRPRKLKDKCLVGTTEHGKRAIRDLRNWVPPHTRAPLQAQATKFKLQVNT